MIRALPWRAKLKAFGIHFGLSAAIFAVILAVVVHAWYPPPFFWIDGGLQITALAAAVDVVAGPLLTLVVYRPGKRGLPMNFALIAAIQAGALAWGVGALYAQRPVLAAYVGHKLNSIYPVTEAQVRAGGLPLEELRGLSQSRPPLVYIELPEDEAEAAQVLSSVSHSVLRQTERFRSVDAARMQRILHDTNRETPEARRFIAEHGGRGEAFAFVPLIGRFGEALLVLSATDAALVGVLATKVRFD